MGILAGAAGLLGGVASGVASNAGSLVGSVLGYHSSKYNRQSANRMNNMNIVAQWLMNQRNLDYAKWEAGENFKRQDEQFAYQKQIDQENFKRQDELFEYQKYLNNNATQIQAADAQKAGINPLAMTGGNLSSGSYSNVNSGAGYSNVSNSANQSWSNISPALEDYSDVINALSAVDRNTNDYLLTKKKIASDKAIASQQSETAKYVADKQADTAKYIHDNASGDTIMSTELKREAQRFAEQNASVVNDINRISANAQKLSAEASSKNADVNEKRQIMEDMNSIYDNAYKSTQDEYLQNYIDYQKSQMNLYYKQFEEAVKNKKFDKAMEIWHSVNETIRSVGSFFMPSIENKYNPRPSSGNTYVYGSDY